MEHAFTIKILDILGDLFGTYSRRIYEQSLLLQYINWKTRSAGKGSKARGSFANLYAIYVLTEDYLEKNYDKSDQYSKYEGAEFSKLLARQRELPFGAKLQNHALNSRMKEEFKKYYPDCEYEPILRNLETNRYWINENLLKVNTDNQSVNIARAVLQIIDEYGKTKLDSFEKFIRTCEELQNIGLKDAKDVSSFIFSLLAPDTDARLFEIVSYAILKVYYHDKMIHWGFDPDPENNTGITETYHENLKLYRTGRTNANDGGIDFLMRPLGRIFQVTESLDFKKYFLDIDKIDKYPITFVVKSDEPVKTLFNKIRDNAEKTYSVDIIVNKYLSCIEELINVGTLSEWFHELQKQGRTPDVLREIITQSKVEFNYI